MGPLQYIKKFEFVERPFGPDDNELTTHWVRWDREGWKVSFGFDGVQMDWDRKLVERVWELRKFICHNLDIHEYEINTLTVSPFSMMILEMDPSLVTYTRGHTVTYILGSSFIVNIDFEQDDNRVYLGSVRNHKEACILIDNHETE